METVKKANLHLPEKPCLTVKERSLFTERGIITVEGPVAPARIRQFSFCTGLCKFRQPKEQHLALIDIANLSEGLVYIAHTGSEIIGYITFHYPEFERWARSGIPCLLELGAIEVSRNWRGCGISNQLVQIPFDTDIMEDKIIVSMECYWFWDLQGSNLTPWEYRNLMEHLLAKGGFVTRLTDDPDIACHPANLLSVRIGSRVPQETRTEFDTICYRGKWLL